MKKSGFFTVSLIAMLAATTARAEIASKAYVEGEINPVATTLNTHVTNGDIHVTASEKSTWSAKQDALGYTAENSGNKRASTDYTSNDKNSETLYPTIKLTNQLIDGKMESVTEELTGLGQSVTGLSTNKQDKLNSTGTGANVVSDGNGNVVTGVSAANGVVTVTRGATLGTMASETASDYYNKTDIGTITNGKTLVEMIGDAQSAATYNDSALTARVAANEGAIETLNGDASTSGSVAKSIADALSGYTLKSVTANNGDGVVTAVTQTGNAVTSTKAKITTSHIADNAGITAGQLATGVQTSLGYADAYHTASATYGDIITHNAAEFASAAADGAVMTVTTDANSTGNVVTAVSGNVDGTVTVTRGITAIPKPDGNCTDCVLHYAGATDQFTWEEIGR